MSNERVSDDLAVYTGDLLATLLTLSWIEEVKPIKVLMGYYSSSALTSIKYMQLDTRHDIVLDIAQTIFRIKE